MNRYALPSMLQGTSSFRVTITVTIVFLLLLDLLAPILIYHLSRGRSDNGGALLIGLTIGFVVGQLVLLAFWGAFGTEPFTKRIPRDVAVDYGMFGLVVRI